MSAFPSMMIFQLRCPHVEAPLALPIGALAEMPRVSSNSSKSGQEGEWSIPSLREPRYSQSLERGLAILGCFPPERPVLGIADIAAELGMNRRATHRYGSS